MLHPEDVRRPIGLSQFLVSFFLLCFRVIAPLSCVHCITNVSGPAQRKSSICTASSFPLEDLQTLMDANLVKWLNGSV